MNADEGSVSEILTDEGVAPRDHLVIVDEVLAELHVFRLHRVRRGCPREGEHGVLRGRVSPAPVRGHLRVVDVVVEGAVRHGPVEVDAEGVPEGTEGVAVLGVARLRLGSLSVAVAEGHALLLGPDLARQRFHELFHGDNAVVLRENGDIEVTGKWDLG